MAFLLKKHAENYTCLSSDMKLTTVQAGSKCEELDTGKKYIFDGTNWVEIVGATSLSGSLANDVTDALPVQLSGSNVEIGGVSFVVSGGDTLRGKSTDKPAAADAHAAIPFCYYHAIDTGAIEVTDGTNWVVV